MKLIRLVTLLICLWFIASPVAAAESKLEAKEVSVQGGVADGNARLIIEALLHGTGAKTEPIYVTSLQQKIKVNADRLEHMITATFDILQGDGAETVLTVQGHGEILQVTGEYLQDWALRRDPKGARLLSLRWRKGDQPHPRLIANISANHALTASQTSTTVLSFGSEKPGLASGYIKIEPVPELLVAVEQSSGLIPVKWEFLPESMHSKIEGDQPEPLAFRFDGSPCSLSLHLTPSDPDGRRVVLGNFKLVGDLTEDAAAFTLAAVARVQSPKGGSITLLSGAVALTEVVGGEGWRLHLAPTNSAPSAAGPATPPRFVAVFDRAGEFPIELRFNAAVRRNAGGSQAWNTLEFKVAPSALQPIFLRGLAEGTEFDFSGAARPERSGREFVSFLPANGEVRLSWKARDAEAESKLFFSAEMLSQVSVGPGLVREAAALDFKIMQGEMNRVGLLLTGEAEVTRVQGDSVLSWRAAPVPNSSNRRLEIQFNQPQKTGFALQIQMQSPIGAFPEDVVATQLRPEGVTRFAGAVRVVNDGAVRLMVVESPGLSQISPEQFPENDVTRALLTSEGKQRFAYRFSSTEFGLRIHADQILPELTVSEILVYHHGENESSIDGEFELDIREAPLRELQLIVPRGYAIARLTAANLSDYFLREPEDQGRAELRLVFGQPVSGRLVVQLRLERNQALGEAEWSLPRLEITHVKSVRGHLAVTADPGFRVTPERTQGVTETATAFFPRKLARIQTAFRLSEPNWEVALRVERLPQTVQADVFHLFSIGEGIAYGSSVMTYLISGAPLSAFRIDLSAEYANVEFTGKDVRSWTRTNDGYVVQLHTPVSGSYTLLASYERPFKAHGESLAFSGTRPVDAQTEQGHTLVISAYQFQVKPVEVSAGLLPLETREVPPEYRLFFDAPILAAYRYTSRPFNLTLALSPLEQGDSLSLVVDRAALTTRISKEGQILTDARYFLKNRGNPHLSLSLPPATQLWSATVDGTAVVPVANGSTSLIPLPHRSDPNAVLTLDLKLASRSDHPNRIRVSAPSIAAPVLLAKWDLTPDTGRKLIYRDGSLTPATATGDPSGFGALARLFQGRDTPVAASLALGLVLLTAITIVVWRWTCQEGVYRVSARHIIGTTIGGLSLILALTALLTLGKFMHQHSTKPPQDITLLAPVQQAGSVLTVEVSNVETGASFGNVVGWTWLALLAMGLWIWISMSGSRLKVLGYTAGWALLAWVALRSPAPVAAVAFPLVLGCFLVLNVGFPAVRRLWQLPSRPAHTPAPPAAGGPASATAIWVAALISLSPFVEAFAAVPQTAQPAPASHQDSEQPLAQVVSQDIRFDKGFAVGTVRIRWQAVKHQVLPLLYEPGVLTHISFPSNVVKLVQAPKGNRRAQCLFAIADSECAIELRYQVQATRKDPETGFTLPTQYGLVNRLSLTLANLDVDVVSPEAVSVTRHAAGSNTVAALVLRPVNSPWIAWRPRTRDVRHEKPVFYAELSQLYVPAAGVIEGAHRVFIRPAQGEIQQLTFTVPQGLTVSDVLDPANPAGGNSATLGLVDSWRFAPDARQLYVTLNPSQSKPFALLVRSQTTVGTLPFEHTSGVVSVEGAAGQIGLLGVATGGEVQLDSVVAANASAINLEDFPRGTSGALDAQIPGLTVRRAYRYADTNASFVIKASAIEPDVRAEIQDTLSLSEDRTVVASKIAVDITRAGIFRLSFVLPTGYDIESVSSAALSHWSDVSSPTGKVVTLHLKGKTEGKQQFDLSLAGPGVKSAQGWQVPQVVLREASKQRGSLLLVPEQGIRLQIARRENLTQLDPEKAGVRQKGVLAFRVLQAPWQLTLDIEQVDAWVQVTTLQQATVSEAAVKVTANLQYQIEATGLKAFRVHVPTNAESVRFEGDQVVDSLPLSNSATNGLQLWEVRLHRRVIGPWFLQLSYQTLLPQNATDTILRGVQVEDVDLHRGFVTIQSGGRLQVRIETPPQALQPTEWQSIPRLLQRNLTETAANFAFRLVEPGFDLPLKLERHEAAKLLPARVNSISLNSVVSDNAVVLTHVSIEMLPGDKRLLQLTLPKNAVFWFAFVNQNGVWPWREQDRILLPLEQQSRLDQPATIEVFYSAVAGTHSGRSLDLQLLAPKFDLPLERIVWRVSLSRKWELKDWTGTLQFQDEQVAGAGEQVDLQSYFQKEAGYQRERSKAAEELLAAGNQALTQGDPQLARRAFQAAYGLSTHDAAFNEDARVQLHNVKLQQALVGLNVHQAATAGEAPPPASKLREQQGRKELLYTQQDAKDLFVRNSAADNDAFMKLAERIIQQQDAVVASPAAIRANIPEQGRVLTFKRSVVIDPWANLDIGLEAASSSGFSWGWRFLVAVVVFVALAVFTAAGRAFRLDRSA